VQTYSLNQHISPQASGRKLHAASTYTRNKTNQLYNQESFNIQRLLHTRMVTHLVQSSSRVRVFMSDSLRRTCKDN